MCLDQVQLKWIITCIFV